LQPPSATSRFRRLRDEGSTEAEAEEEEEDEGGVARDVARAGAPRSNSAGSKGGPSTLCAATGLFRGDLLWKAAS
jgi:hypothetical protein